jgi:hypothetical protein
MDIPPLALDIDGTLTRQDGHGIDPRVFEPLSEWPAPIVLATGKAFPYPVALCHFSAIPERVVAENGGIAYADGKLTVIGNGGAAREVAEAYVEAGYELGWSDGDTVNRWRETEIAIERSQPREPLEALAAEHGLEVVDTGYAYHVKDPSMNKGQALETVAETLELSTESFLAIGDSINDVSTFERVGQSYAVENADEAAKAAADEVLDGAHAEGTLSVLSELRSA